MEQNFVKFKCQTRDRQNCQDSSWYMTASHVNYTIDSRGKITMVTYHFKVACMQRNENIYHWALYISKVNLLQLCWLHWNKHKAINYISFVPITFSSSTATHSYMTVWTNSSDILCGKSDLGQFSNGEATDTHWLTRLISFYNCQHPKTSHLTHAKFTHRNTHSCF